MSVAAVRRVVCRFDANHPSTDTELVMAIVPGGTGREAAFGELVGRYGPMVLGVCRRVLSDAHAADDAFQAVFIVLAQKASTIRPPGSVAGWLYGVAVRTARKAKTTAARRRRREMVAITSASNEPTGREPESPAERFDRSELRAIIDAELAALPEAHRTALLLCDLHGKTRAEAAAELNRAEGTVASWLARGRKALAARLSRRGVTLPAAGLATAVVPETVSAELAASVTSTFAGHEATASVLTLAEGVMKSLSSVSTKLTAAALAVGALLVAVTTATAWFVGDRTIPLNQPVGVPAFVPPPEPTPSAWKEKTVLDLTGWLAGSVVYSPDGKTLFVGGTGGHVRAYDASTLKHLWESNDGDSFAAVSPSGDGKTLAATFKDGVRFLDATTGKIGDVLEEKGSEPTAVAFFPDVRFNAGGILLTSRKIIFGNANGTFVKTWVEWPKVSTIQSTAVAAGEVPLAVSPDGKRTLVKGPIDKHTQKQTLWAWAAGSGAENILLEEHKAPVVSVAWANNGKWIVTGDTEGVLITWDAEKFKEKSRLSLGGRIAAVAVSHDGTSTAAAVILPDPKNKDSYAEEVFVWPTANPPVKPEPISRHSAGGPFRGVAGLAFAPDGKTLVSVFSNFDHLTKLGALVGHVRVFALTPAPEKPAPNVRFITDTSFNPDGTKYVVVAGGKAEVFDTSTGKPLYSVAAEAARFGTDGKTLFVMGEKVLECEADTGKTLKTHPRPKTKWMWHHVAFAPDGKRYVAHFGFHARIYDTATGFEPVQLDGQFETAGWLQGVTGSSIGFSPDGKRIVAVGVLVTEGGQLGAAVWDAESGKSQHKFLGGPSGPRAAAFSIDSKALAISYEELIQVWADGKMKLITLLEGAPVTAMAFHPNGNQLAAGIRLPIVHDASAKVPRIIGYKTEVRLIDTATSKVVKLFDGFEGGNHTDPTKLPVTTLAFNSPGNKLIAGTGIDRVEWPVKDAPKSGEVKVFDLPGLPEKPAPAVGRQWFDTSVLEDHSALVNGVAIAPDGKSFTAATEENVTCWDSVTQKKIWSHKLDAPAFALAYHPDGKYLFVAGKADLIRLDAATGEKKTLYGNASGVGFDNYIRKTRDSHARQLAFSQDGKKLVLSDGHMTWTVEPENPENHQIVGAAPEGAKPGPAGVAWAPDSKRFASIQPKRTERNVPSGRLLDTHWPVRIWSTDGTVFARSLNLLGHDHPVTAIAWSKDGTVIASGDEKGFVILWDAATGKELWRSRQFRGRDDTDGRINALTISPTDNTVAVAVSLGSGKGADRVALLTAKDGAVYDQVMRGSLPITSVAWSKDGTMLVTGAGTLSEPGGASAPVRVGEVVVWERKR